MTKLKWRVTFVINDFIMPGDTSTFTYYYETLKDVRKALKRWSKWMPESITITLNKKED